MEFPYTEAQTAWLDELATTAKPQCNGVLRSEDGFCCLGIALDLRGDGEWSTLSVSGNKVHAWALGAAAGWTKEGGTSEKFPELHSGEVTTTLPMDVAMDLGLRAREGSFSEKKLTAEDKASLPDRRENIGGHVWSLTVLNDADWSFARIAAFIRRNPRAIFTNLDKKGAAS